MPGLFEKMPQKCPVGGFAHMLQRQAAGDFKKYFKACDVGPSQDESTPQKIVVVKFCRMTIGFFLMKYSF